jgi:hypothetical protein
MVFICAVFFTAAWAQDKKPDEKQVAATVMDDKEKADILIKVDLFYKVVSYGEDQKNPLILISAVKLLDDLPFDSIPKQGQDEKTGAQYDRLSLLNQAKGYAPGDTELLALIEKVQNPPETTEVRSGGSSSGSNYYKRSSTKGNRTFYAQSSLPMDLQIQKSMANSRRNAPVPFGGGLCFIATAAYGSPFAERVEVLQRFRDQRLIHTALGVAFVNFYYQHSPALANVISESPIARAITRILLYPVTVIAGACLGQTADIVQIILVFAILLVSAALVYQRKRQMSPRC